LKENIEEALEETQTTGVELNYDLEDIEAIFEQLILCENVPDSLKKHLFFL
jgi:hypothetical protein